MLINSLELSKKLAQISEEIANLQSSLVELEEKYPERNQYLGFALPISHRIDFLKGQASILDELYQEISY